PPTGYGLPFAPSATIGQLKVSDTPPSVCSASPALRAAANACSEVIGCPVPPLGSVTVCTCQIGLYCPNGGRLYGGSWLLPCAPSPACWPVPPVVPYVPGFCPPVPPVPCCPVCPVPCWPVWPVPCGGGVVLPLPAVPAPPY